VAHPLFEDIDEEAAVLFASHRAFRDQIAGLRVEQTLAAGLLAPALVGDLDRLLGGALDDRNELHPLCAKLVAEESIDRAAMLFIGGVDRAKDVEFDAMPAQVSPTVHHPIEGALSAAIDTVRVMELARPVDAEPDEKIVLLEEGAPVIVEKHAVGLKRVLYDLLGPTVLFDELDRAPEEFEFHQRRLAALPRHRHLRRAVRLQQLTDVGLERSLGHPVLFVRIQRLLGQEEAIRAIDVARGPARLRQQMKARRGIGR
jgi:hypothetical protein